MFKRFILILVLLIIFLSLSAFFFNVYTLQSNYFSNRNNNDSAIEDVKEVENTNNDSPSVYTSYSEDIYNKAILEKRVIVLFFNANWCDNCIKQSAVNSEVFNELTRNGVVGLESHILDSETTTDLDGLAKKFDVRKESTFIILDKNGAVVYRYTGTLDKELLKTKIMEVGDII